MNVAELGKRIRSRREKHGLTQNQVANSLQISPQAVSKWERGENAPDISILMPLATLLDVPVEWILTGNKAPTPTFDATVLSSSLRGFAQHAETLDPQQVATKINGVFHVLTEAILQYGGVPVKYVGDGMLAYFSGPRSGQRAVTAAQAAVDICPEEGLLVTLKSGPIYVGSIGHADYARPDIMGSTVNQVFLMNHWANAQAKGQIYADPKTVEKSDYDFNGPLTMSHDSGEQPVVWR